MENALPLITTEEVFNVLENTYYQLTDIIKNTAPGVIGRNTTVEFGPEYTKSYYVGNYDIR